MKKEIKIIALDMDGTTLNSEKKITLRVQDAIKKAIAKGVVVLPATGRTLNAVPKEMLAIKDIRYLLLSNGAVIYDRLKKQPVLTACLDIIQTKQILAALAGLDVQMHPYVDGKAYMTTADKEILSHFVEPEYIEYFHWSRGVVEDMNTFLDTAVSGIEKIYAMFASSRDREKARGILADIPGLIITSSLESNLEINRNDANKGDALLALGQLWDIRPDQIMACGDNTNDAAMIEKAGIGVAMGNAVSSLKELANFVTLSNDEDGVAYAIEKFIL